MKRFAPEAVDLARLARNLSAAFPAPPTGAIVGRTQLRDQVAHELECSLLEAEQMVDTMVARGFLSQRQAPNGLVHWTIRSRAD